MQLQRLPALSTTASIETNPHLPYCNSNFDTSCISRINNLSRISRINNNSFENGRGHLLNLTHSPSASSTSPRPSQHLPNLTQALTGFNWSSSTRPVRALTLTLTLTNPETDVRIKNS